VQDAVLGAPAPDPSDQEHAFRHGHLGIGWVDARQLDDDGHLGRALRAVDVDGRSEPSPGGDEPRHLAEIGEELLHLRLQTVSVLARAHETIVPMSSILKASGAAVAFVLYVWFAAVKSADLVKERKRSRHRFDDGRSLH
jgi:hypothetical protein